MSNPNIAATQLLTLHHLLPQDRRSLKIWFVPDTHGNLKLIAWLYEQAVINKVSAIIQLGDFGWNWPSKQRRNYHDQIGGLFQKTKHDIPWFFIPGNHDNWTKINKNNKENNKIVKLKKQLFVLQRNAFIQIGPFKIFCFGGAESTDYQYRSPDKKKWFSPIPGLRDFIGNPLGYGPWWMEESPSQKEITEAYSLSPFLSPDIVISHDCPIEVRPERESGINPYSGYPLDYTAKILSTIFRKLKTVPDLWIHGHHHNFSFQTPDLTSFICPGRFDSYGRKDSIVEINDCVPNYKHFNSIELRELPYSSGNMIKYKVFLLEKKK